MFYCYDGGAGKLYFRTVDETCFAAHDVHLRQGIDVNRITVYELLTDRIVYQFCYVCNRATPWVWDEGSIDVYAHHHGDRKRVKRGLHPSAFCERCGNVVSDDVPTVNTGDCPVRNLQMLFELLTNRGFSIQSLLQEIKPHRVSPNISVGQACQLLFNQLDKKRRCRMVQTIQTPEIIKKYNTPLSRVLRSMQTDELRSNMMDMNALQGIQSDGV